MMSLEKKTYAFGGITVQIVSPFDVSEEEKYRVFRVPDVEAPDFVLRLNPTEGACAAGGSVAPTVTREGNCITLTAAGDRLERMTCLGVFSQASLPFLFLEKDAFVLHASYIIRNGRAVLFTAPSGVGKSTQASLWKEHRNAEVVNGDRVLITARGGEYYANGIYMSGKSGLCRNVTAPIDRVILLKQGEKNELCPLRPHLLYLQVMCQCTYDIRSETQSAAVGGLLGGLFSRVPVHCYRCRNHPDAVSDLERLVWKKDNP